VLYKKAEQRLRSLRSIFGAGGLEIFLSIRNPATFLPAMLQNTPHGTLEALVQGLDPHDLRWSDLVARMVRAVPDVPLTVWCDEDSPLVWGEVVREMAGVPATFDLIGQYSRMAEIMTKEGMDRFRTYIGERPDLTEMQVRRVMVAFLDKYADPAKLEDELDLPGWTDDMVQDLTEQYEEDLFEIGRLPGVTLITP